MPALLTPLGSNLPLDEIPEGEIENEDARDALRGMECIVFNLPRTS